MKTTATISQEELEQKAIDSMIAYEKNLISGQKWRKQSPVRCITTPTGKDTGKSF